MTGLILICVGLLSLGWAIVMALNECLPPGSGGVGGFLEAFDDD